MDKGFSCRKNAFFPGVHKIDAPISGPRIADKNFTDTRIFLKNVVAYRGLRVGLSKTPKVADMCTCSFSRRWACVHPVLETNVIGRPGDHAMEMNGRSAAPYLVHTLCVPVL